MSEKNNFFRVKQWKPAFSNATITWNKYQEIVLCTWFQPHSLGNDQKNKIFNNTLKKRVKHPHHMRKSICPPFRKPKKIKFLMSLKRPESDTNREIPDFGGVRRGLCASCVDMAEIVTLKIPCRKTQLSALSRVSSMCAMLFETDLNRSKNQPLNC